MLLEMAIGNAYAVAAEKNSYFLNDLKYHLNPITGEGDGRFTSEIETVINQSLHVLTKYKNKNLLYNKDIYCNRFDKKLNKNPLNIASQSCPIGFLSSSEEILKFNKFQSISLNLSNDAEAAGIFTSLSCFYFLNKIGKKIHLTEFLFPHIQYDKIDIQLYNTLMQIDEILQKSISYNCILKNCLGADTHLTQITSISMGIASCINGFIKDISSHLYLGLYNGKHGRKYLEEIDKKLIELHQGDDSC